MLNITQNKQHYPLLTNIILTSQQILINPSPKNSTPYTPKESKQHTKPQTLYQHKLQPYTTSPKTYPPIYVGSTPYVMVLVSIIGFRYLWTVYLNFLLLISLLWFFLWSFVGFGLWVCIAYCLLALLIRLVLVGLVLLHFAYLVGLVCWLGCCLACYGWLYGLFRFSLL